MEGAKTRDGLGENQFTKVMALRAGTRRCSHIRRWVELLTLPIPTDVAIIRPISSLPSTITLTKCLGWIVFLKAGTKTAGLL